MRYKEFITETMVQWVFHASYMPDLASGLSSVSRHGLRPSKTGYTGPGVYFAYTPEGCYDHVDRANATMLRCRWSELVNLYGIYPETKTGVQRTSDEIIVPGPVPAAILEVEYFEDEWWPVADAVRAETRSTKY
jgi:hypothetical protein